MKEHHLDGDRIKQLRSAVKLKHLLSLMELNQRISSPTQTLQNPFSCTDLIFANKPNFVIDCGRHLSLQANCHYKKMYSKLNLKTDYPPPYEQLAWDYENSDSQVIKEAI